MNLTPELKARIDALPYEELLRRWRMEPAGSDMFQGESGTYWRDRMAEVRNAPGGDARHTAASKDIGWRRAD